MDVDEDEEGTQRPKKVQDYGIEVEFDLLDDEEREVSVVCRTLDVSGLIQLSFRTTLQKCLLDLTLQSRN